MTINIRLSARLRAARKAAGFKTSKAFIKKHNIPASTYSQHESGSRLPDDKTLKFYSKTFDVNFDWLKSGKGNPFSTMSVHKKNTMDEELLNITHLSDAKSKKPTPDITIDQKLLSNLLEEIASLYQIKKTKPPFSIIVKGAVEIYADIISKNPMKKNLLKMIKSSLNTYKKNEF